MSRYKELFKTINQLERDEIPYAIATVFAVSGSSSGKLGDKAIFGREGDRITGFIGGGCIENRVAAIAKESLEDGQPKTIEIDLDSDKMEMGIPCGGYMSVIVEPQMKDKTILIKGVGSITEFLCQMASLLKFKVIVLTTKQDKDRYPDASKVIVGNLEIQDIDFPVDYFILATHHRNDDQVSLEALRKGISYVGVVASEKKAKIIYEFLKKNNLATKQLENFFSPVGLELNAKTPEQIALSILSEMIMLENKGTSNSKRVVMEGDN